PAGRRARSARGAARRGRRPAAPGRFHAAPLPPGLWPRARCQNARRTGPGMSGAINLVELREGGPHDLQSVNRIMQEAFDPRFGEAWTSAQCLGMLSLPGVWLVVASIDGEDAGFALARAVVDEAELLLLATRPAARRRGVAGALLRA